MPWPKGRSRRGVGRKPIWIDCPSGHIGQFSRTGTSKWRKCLVCQRERTAGKRRAKKTMERAA
jgi:hypothetical protein